MKVIVLGAGQVGYSIARYLSFEENDVTLVDHSSTFLKQIGDSLDLKPVVGHASHPDVLEAAGAKEADLIIAVTGSDEVNIVACEVAHALFGVETKIARLRSAQYTNERCMKLFGDTHIAIDHIISPEEAVSASISRSMEIMGAFNVIPLAEKRMTCIGIKCVERAPVLHTPLRLLPTAFPKLSMAVLCVSRQDKTFIPRREEQLLPGDEVYLLCDSRQLSEIIAAFGFSPVDSRRSLIIGGGHIGLSLARHLEKQPRVSCKLIEHDKDRAEAAAHALVEGEVICGDAMSPAILREASAGSMDTVVALTNDDKVNTLSALLAKREGAKHVMCLLNNMAYAPFVSSLGVDAIINPRSITVSTILHHIRQGRVHAVHSLRNDFAELMDVEARETSVAVGMSIGEITSKETIFVAAMVRDDHVIFLPSLKTAIRIHDRLILCVKKRAVVRIEELFSFHSGYLG